ncbi:MAG TPA: ABC transporter, partial [Opitutaceae bacterium]|nr:ABC transporter [Opitutaceae bacterium]
IADTDWLFDDYSVRRLNFLGVQAAEPLNDNLAFASNSLELLGGSEDLISIRGKGSSLRPFTVVRQMEVAAQKRYQDQLAALEGRLSEVQTKLSDLQGKRTDGNRLVATPEMQKAIEEFQAQQATMRGERREIRKALREDIERLENKLLAINIVIPVLMVGAFGVLFWRSRRS